MFKSLVWRGVRGSISWGYRSAASLPTWTIKRELDEKKKTWSWTLAATLGPQVDRFQLRQRPLLFTAPRKGGHWCWEVRELRVGERTVVATLGPLEQ